MQRRRAQLRKTVEPLTEATRKRKTILQQRLQGYTLYNEGVYYGTAEGYNGDIIVAIVIQRTRSKAVLVIGEEDDDTFFNCAMDVVTDDEETEHGSDTVSGATLQFELGLIQAVKNALEEARRHQRRNG